MTEAEIQKQENEKKNAELARCYKRMALTDDGKKIMEDLESACNFKRTSIDSKWNANKTFFHEGMRNVYLHILSKIERKENG
jgi:hypothetical protein